MADSNYRDLTGVVAFDPVERDVNGKTVMNISIRTVGVKEQSQLVSCTLWPSHQALFGKIEKGDILYVQGKYAVKAGEKDGNPVRYHNLSISGITKIGALDFGEKVETTDDAGDGAADDDEAW